MNKRTFHRVNGIFLAIFVALHMMTHLSGLWGIDTYETTQKMMRILYRNVIIEPVLLMSMVLQIGVGIALIRKNFRRKMAEKWARRQTLSGLIFLFFIVQHLPAMALARWVEGLDTSFFWPASVMSGAPFYWYFTPYYFLGVTAMFVHLGCASRLYLLRQKSPVAAVYAFWTVSSAGALIAILLVCMLLGVFYEIELPPEWITYLNQFVAGYRP